MSDKRLLPFATDCGKYVIFCERTSEKDWHYCKYCYRKTPSFILEEAIREKELPPGIEPILHQVLRCCWECGAGTELLWGRNMSDIAAYSVWPQANVPHSGLARC